VGQVSVQVPRLQCLEDCHMAEHLVTVDCRVGVKQSGEMSVSCTTEPDRSSRPGVEVDWGEVLCDQHQEDGIGLGYSYRHDRELRPTDGLRSTPTVEPVLGSLVSVQLDGKEDEVHLLDVTSSEGRGENILQLQHGNRKNRRGTARAVLLMVIVAITCDCISYLYISTFLIIFEFFLCKW
jgi:hypothetical protein